MSKFISPTGSIELDNDCQYSIDLRSTRSRESVVPAEDLAFYFNTYIEPKYGLGNINVSNCASFMKDLEMNWTKLTPDLKDKVLNIMVDYILKGDGYDFKSRLLAKLGESTGNTEIVGDNNGSSASSVNKPKKGKSPFGESSTEKNNNFGIWLIAVIGILVIIAMNKPKIASYAKF